MNHTTTHRQASLGALVATLRKQKFDPVESRMWSQSQLAHEAGLTLKMIGDIERGRRVNIDDDTLIRLANALQLSLLERRYFYQMATLMQPQRTPFPRGSTNEYLENRLKLVADMQVPAVLHDNLFNLIATNDLWWNYYSLDSSDWNSAVLPFNLLRMAVDPLSPINRQLGEEWRALARRIMYRFRAFSMPDVATPRYRATLQALMQFKRFKPLWMESVHQSENMIKDTPAYNYNHARFGAMRVILASEQLVTNLGSFYLTVTVPGNLATIKLFEKLSRTSRAKAHRLQPFPS